MYRVAVTVAAACLLWGSRADAQIVLTLQDTITLAREQAGAVPVARARIAEAEAGILDASPRFRDNPSIEIGGGPRSGTDDRRTDLELTVSQPFETGRQRQARLAAATAAVERARADAVQASRTAIFEAASAFIDGLAAAEHLRLAEAADTVSRELLAITERRYGAGDIAAIDVNLARIEAARTAAVLASSQVELTAAIGLLRGLLRLPAGEPVELRGSLDVTPTAALPQLEATIDQLPQLAALNAEVRQGEAETDLGRALAKPDIGVRASYAREDGDTIVLGGLTVTLPAFQRGRGTLATGLARATRSRIERDVTRDLVLARLRAAVDESRQRSALAVAFSESTVATVADNETLAQRSYEAGEMNLLDLLLVRRDALDTRTLIIDRRLDAAKSRLAVDFISGVLR